MEDCSSQFSLAVPRWLAWEKERCHTLDLNGKCRDGHLTHTYYIQLPSPFLPLPSELASGRRCSLCLCWIYFPDSAGVGWMWGSLCELGAGGFIVSSRCWSSQDRWVRLESDTPGRLSHRAPSIYRPMLSWPDSPTIVFFFLKMAAGKEDGNSEFTTSAASTWPPDVRLCWTPPLRCDNAMVWCDEVEATPTAL